MQLSQLEYKGRRYGRRDGNATGVHGFDRFCEFIIYTRAVCEHQLRNCVLSSMTKVAEPLPSDFQDMQ